MEEMQGELITKEKLIADFIKLGVAPAMTIIMHSLM